MLIGFLSAFVFSGCSLGSSSSLPESSVESSESSTSETSSEVSSIILTYTISFEENGGTTVTDMTQEAGSSVSAPTAPTKTGYTFGGWYSDSGLATSYTFLVMPSQNITLYAKWQINQYTITFETNGGSLVTAITQDYLSTVSAPTPPTKTGYSFVGWYSDAALTVDYTFTTMPLGGMTVYAQWTVNEYTISFNSNGGTAVTPITQDFGTPVEDPAPPTRLGYEFEGWFQDEALTIAYSFTTMPGTDMTLYAKWELSEFTITFVSNGGTLVEAIVQDYGTPVSAPEDPTRLGYLFGGWFNDVELTTLYTFTTIPAEDITLYAKWEIDPLYGVLTIDEFKNVGDSDYHEVAGTVLFAAGEAMGIIVIADATGTLVANSTGIVTSGDFVKFGGSLGFMGDYPMLTAEDTGTTLLMVLDHDRPIPMEPTEITISDYNALDPNLSSTWIQYLKVTGTLTVDAIEHTMSLVDGTDVLPLLVMDMETYLLFMQYKHFEISVCGISLPNFDVDPVLMFVFTGVPTDISMDYTPLELVTMMSAGIGEYYAAIDFIPGEIIDLPVNHPLVPVVITYETLGPNANLFDLLNFKVSPTIVSETYIDLRVTVTLPEVNATADFQLHIVPLVPTSIATFRSMMDDETTYYTLQGVIIHLQLENNFMMIADATGVCYVITDNTSLLIGDEVVVSGVKMSSSGMTFLANDPSTTVRAILSSGNSMPLTPAPITIPNFAALDINEPANTLVYFSLTGTLHEDVEGHRYYLSDGTINIPIYVPYEDAYASLAGYVGTSVIISGLSTPVVEQGFMMLVYFNLPGTISAA